MKKGFYIVTIILNILIINVSCTKKKPEQVVKGNITFKGNYQQNDMEYFMRFFKEMQNAVENRDAERAFSFYSKNFMNDMGISLKKLKSNTEKFYKDYDKIVYKMSNISVNLKDDKALSIDDFEFSAEPVKKGYEPIHYKGTERIYWQKENDTWKIVNWIYER